MISIKPQVFPEGGMSAQTGGLGAWWWTGGESEGSRGRVYMGV